MNNVIEVLDNDNAMKIVSALIEEEYDVAIKKTADGYYQIRYEWRENGGFQTFDEFYDELKADGIEFVEKVDN